MTTGRAAKVHPPVSLFALTDDEVGYLIQSRACLGCDHLEVFHANFVGHMACNVPGCSCFDFGYVDQWGYEVGNTKR